MLRQVPVIVGYKLMFSSRFNLVKDGFDKIFEQTLTAKNI